VHSTVLAFCCWASMACKSAWHSGTHQQSRPFPQKSGGKQKRIGTVNDFSWLETGVSALKFLQCLVKGKEYHTRWRVLVGCSSPLLRPWARRWIHHVSLWCMASVTPDLRSPSQSQDIAAPRLVPSYTAWWQRHMYVNNLPSRYLTAAQPGVELATSRVASWVNALTVTPPLVPHIPRCCLLDRVKEENWGELANPGSPGKQLLKQRQWCDVLLICQIS